VPVDVELSIAATIQALAAVGGFLILAGFGCWKSTRAPGARRIMMAGTLVGAAWIPLSAGIAALTPGAHVRWALAGTFGVPLAAGLLLAGIERLPGVIDSAATRLRRRLDVAVMAPAIFLTGWTLAVVSGDRSPSMPVVLAGGPPVIALTIVLAFGIALVVRSESSRRAVALLMAGVTAAALGGTLVVAGLLTDSSAPVLGGGVVVAAAWVVLGCCSALWSQLVRPLPADPPIGWSMSVVTISLALCMIVIEVVRTGSLDAVGSAAGVLTGFALVSRQGLALVDANRLARRLRDEEVALRELAFTDALTGVANRRELLRILDEAAADATPRTLLALDLDGFKNINDLRGHDVGDAVLIEVAARLRANLRPGDLAARLGGDEFAVLMRAREDDAMAAANRLLAALAAPYRTAVGAVFVSASIGLAGHDSAADVPGLLRNADLALRFAKQRGKGRCERYDKRYEEWLRRRTDIEHELREAAARGEFSLVYQPVMTLPGGVTVGVEALIRWSHPRLGTIGPDEFIPIAEESGMIAMIDTWVLGEGARQLGLWLAEGHDLWLSVNVSARELHVAGYAADVLAGLRVHRVPPDHLVLEITERTVAEDIDELVTQLDALRAAGVRIAVDDFGAGYSSLGQLRTLPVDILKIDRSLVGEPGREATSRETAPLVDVVVQLGNRLGLMVIAEGVADPAEREIVERAGCAFVQGRLFARPMPAEHVELILSGHPIVVPGPRRPQLRGTGTLGP
jgi:diguanylate cyclase (GGDEF)-like protein